MATETSHPEPTPDRTDVIPESYAVYVTEEWVHVWQYRVNISEPEGTWCFVETLNRENDPKLSLDHASPLAPTPDGYWIYSRTYHCETDVAAIAVTARPFDVRPRGHPDQNSITPDSAAIPAPRRRVGDLDEQRMETTVGVATPCVRRCGFSSAWRWNRAALRLRGRHEAFERSDSLVAAVCVLQDRQQGIGQYHNRALVHLQFDEPPVPT